MSDDIQENGFQDLEDLLGLFSAALEEQPVTVFNLAGYVYAALCPKGDHLGLFILDDDGETTEAILDCDGSVFAEFVNDVCQTADAANDRLVELSLRDLILLREAERASIAHFYTDGDMPLDRPELPDVVDDDDYRFWCEEARELTRAFIESHPQSS